jgi:porphobilinogen synthase
MNSVRPRRLRRTPALRDLVSETTVSGRNLMLPLFVKEGLASPKPIEGMYGVVQHSEDSFLEVLTAAVDSGIKAVMIFGVPQKRDALGSEAYSPEGILSRSVARAKKHVGDDLVIFADLCLDEFTDHGHCGVLDGQGEVDNDATLELYQKMAVTLAHSGADFLGLSGMMDNQVSSIRSALDEESFESVGLLAYAAKYASSFYAPFRNAVESTLKTDRKTYQQDWRNSREAGREIQEDLDQGADIIMVKPALSYLDIVAKAAEQSDVPVAAYQVSGEMAMIEAAAEAGLVDRKQAILETTFGMRRAGASIVCTYFALEIAKWMREEL